MDDFLHSHQDDQEIQTTLEFLKRENSRDAGAGALQINESNAKDVTSAPSAYCLWLMSQDRKSTPLKTIQGRIWEQGYINGELRVVTEADQATDWSSASRHSSFDLW